MYSNSLQVLDISVNESGKMSISERFEMVYFDCLANHMGRGWDRIKIVLKCDDAERRLHIIETLMNEGVPCQGKQYYVSFATAAAKGGTLIACAQKGLGQTYFAKETDVIRPAAYLTPCMGRIWWENCPVEVTEDDRVGDGMFLFDPALLWQSTAFQARGYIPSLNALFKGMGVPVEGLGKIVAHKGCIKSDQKIPAFFHDEMLIGKVTDADSCEMTIGYQVSQNWPKPVWNAIMAESDSMIRENYRRTADPLTYAKEFTNEDLRTPAMKLRNDGLFGAAAKICSIMGNADILGSNYFIDAFENRVARDNTQICVSGGTKAIGLFAICLNELANFVIAVNPADWDKAKGWRNTLIRYPSEDLTCQIAVKLILRNDIPRGCFAMNKFTGNAAGFDFDGDRGALIHANQSKAMELLWAHLHGTQKIVTDNGRQYGQPPNSHAEMINRIMSINIGYIANTISDLEALRWMYPNDTELHGHLDRGQALLKVELRKAVDGAKKAALPDMELVKKMANWAKKKGLKAEDASHMRYISNGTVTGWRKHPTGFATETLAVEKGEWVAPWETVSTVTPIGQMFNEVGPQLVSVRHDKRKHNGHFLNWLALIPGDGAEFAKREMQIAIDGLRRASILEEGADERRTEVTTAWMNLWASKLSMPEDWKRSAVSYLWQRSYKSEHGQQTFLWLSMPEVILEMLAEAKLANVKPTIEGRIIGKNFSETGFDRDYFGSFLTEGQLEALDEESFIRIDVLVADTHYNGTVYQTVTYNGGTFRTSEVTPFIERGQMTITVLKNKTPGSFSFTVYGQTEQESLILAGYDEMISEYEPE